MNGFQTYEIEVPFVRDKALKEPTRFQRRSINLEPFHLVGSAAPAAPAAAGSAAAGSAAAGSAAKSH